MFRLSTSYRFSDALAGWRIGGAVRAQNAMFRTANTMYQGGYSIMDLSASWQVNPKLDVRFNITNVFDKYYYATIGSNAESASAFGEPRNFQVTARYKF